MKTAFLLSLTTSNRKSVNSDKINRIVNDHLGQCYFIARFGFKMERYKLLNKKYLGAQDTFGLCNTS